MSWQTLRDGIDAYWASLVSGYTGTLRTAEKAGLVTAVARGVIDELGGGGGSQPIIIRPDTITPGARHEIVDGWMGLRYRTGFYESRNILLADGAEYGWNVINSANVASANENTSNPGQVTINPTGGAAKDWYPATYTAPKRTKLFPCNQKTQFITARLATNCAAVGDVSGIMIHGIADTGKFIRSFFQRSGANVLCGTQNNAGVTGPMLTVTPATAANGVWFRIMIDSRGYVWGWQNATFSATPPIGGWTLGVSNQGTGGLPDITGMSAGYYCGNSAGGTNQLRVLYYDDRGMGTPIDGETYPTWGAGYDIASTAIQILDVDDAGASSNTEIKALFTGLAAKAGSTATLQVSGKRSGGAGSAFVTWSTPAAWAGVDGAGDWLRLGLRWVSDGTQPGNVFLGSGVTLRTS